MDKKRKIIAIAVIAIAAILVIFFLIKMLNKSRNVEAPVDSSTSTPTEINDATLPTPGDRPNIDYSRYDISQEAPHQTDVEDVAKTAMFFAERLGSFSNQSDYGNINDLMMFMTDSMQAWAKNYINTLRAANGTSQYYGISTSAITYTVNSFDEDKGEAEISVATKRQEIKGTEEKSFNQSLKVLLVKDGSDWKVDGAYWEK